ncbi:MAG: diguanylate cyclase [Campylobacterota bacterium]
MNNIKRGYFLSVFVLFVLISYSVIYGINGRTVEKLLADETQHLFLEYKTIYHNNQKIADLIFSTEVNTPRVIELFKNREREKLYEHLSINYKKFRAFSVRQFHFHLPNNDSFLRVHRPLKFGDNLSEVRSTIRYVNENRKRMHGFEEGKLFNGFRFVYPLFDGTKHIGSVEISFSALAFIKEIVLNYKIQSNFLIDKSIVNEKVLKSEQLNYLQSPVPEYYFQNSIIKFLNNGLSKKVLSKEIANNIHSQIQEGKPFSIYDKGLSQIVTFIPMKNPITNRVTASFTFHSEDVFIAKESETSMLLFLISIGVIGLTLLLVYKELGSRAILHQKIEERTKELLVLNEKLEQMAHVDSLTGAYNRRYFYEISKKIVSFAKREKNPLSLAMLDIDKFKNINDKYGHDIGDEILKIFVNKIKHNIRESDIFVRYGGEEFIILLPNTDREHALLITEKLREIIESCDVIAEVRFTVSIGVSTFFSSADNIENLIKRADKALYEAKNSGRNRVVCSRET